MESYALATHIIRNNPGKFDFLGDCDALPVQSKRAYSDGLRHCN